MRSGAAGNTLDELVPVPSARAWWLPVLVLALCHAQAIASFQILNILIDPIKASLAISDTQYSLLQGVAVAIFAAALGIPAARWGDTHSRRTVIFVGAVGWSLATAACGLAANFEQMFAGRVLMGIGEVFLFPAALSLVANAVPRSKLSSAIALFASGGPIGAGAALAGGGWIVSNPDGIASWFPILANFEPWRIALIVCGATGIITAILLGLVREPPRSETEQHYSFSGVLIEIRKRWRTFAGVSGGMLCLALCAFATAAWTPTVLVRAHGMSYSSAGQFTAAGAIIGGTLLLWATGWVIDFLERNDRPDAVIVVSLCVSLALAALSCGAALSSATPVAVTLYGFVYALLGVPTLLAGAALQMISPDRIRAQIMAIHLLLVNLVSLSLGPLAVALITERVFKSPASVGYSLGVVDLVAALAAAALFILSRKGFVRCNVHAGRDANAAATSGLAST